MIDASIAHGIMLKDPMRLACRDVGPDATVIKRYSAAWCMLARS
jgi:hypothetical protein